ncbi:MAG: CPBP family intramembrane metalloprotease [Myxococcales bacterium]|nr:CPBP family intramembrane metalloprotease [Myxococcales bacterium]
MSSSSLPTQRAYRAFVVFGLLMLAWTGAWLLKLHIDHAYGKLESAQTFLFWTSAKLLVWLVPAWWLFRRSGRNLKQMLGLQRIRSWLAWGGGIGLLIASTALVPKWLSGKPLLPQHLSYALLNALLIAPLFEEFLCRGVLLEEMQQRYTFWIANILTAIFFLILHIPGWYFMGRLYKMFSIPLGGAFSIFLLGLCFGYATHRSRSLMGGILAHFLNNLAV